MPGASVLVTGGAGFIGSELVRQLAAQGKRVTVVDNLANGKRENLEGLPAELVRLAVVDVRSGARLRALLKGVSTVYHLACLGVRHSIHSPEENHSVNAEGTLRLLLEARRAKVKRLVYVSSSEVYGTAKTVPMDELHPAFPMTVYGASKLAGECYARAFWHTYRYPAVVVRPFNSFGPRCHHEGDSGEVIPKFLLRALAGKPLVVFGDGTQTRDFTFVEDTARGIILAGTKPAAVGQTFNLGSGREITINALAREVGRTVAKPVAIARIEPRPGDVLRLYADSRKAKRVLGFAPRVSLGEGLARLKAWYEASGKKPEALLKSEKARNWTR